MMFQLCTYSVGFIPPLSNVLLQVKKDMKHRLHLSIIGKTSLIMFMLRAGLHYGGEVHRS